MWAFIKGWNTEIIMAPKLLFVPLDSPFSDPPYPLLCTVKILESVFWPHYSPPQIPSMLYRMKQKILSQMSEILWNLIPINFCQLPRPPAPPRSFPSSAICKLPEPFTVPCPQRRCDFELLIIIIIIIIIIITCGLEYPFPCPLCFDPIHRESPTLPTQHLRIPCSGISALPSLL